MIKTFRRVGQQSACCAYSCSSKTRYMSSGRPVRVRFAPSPTGHLHLGGLRTALYNYLFARSHNGKFILRIEDTDRSRIVPGAMERIESVLNWTGIQIDEGPNQGGSYGPYTQSERKWLYWEMIQTLLENGSAYRCFCSEKRIHLLRKEAMRMGETPKYDNKCRFLKQKEIDDNLRNAIPYTIRLKLEPNTDPWHDLVYGPIICDIAATEGDPILIKTDRYPTYHFANVVDDHLMEISHVLRGVEWQVSTAKHVLMYNAFGWEPPQFAHLPLLLNSKREKLSKRQNDASVDYYKDMGFLPEALVSMLTSSGGGFKERNRAHLTINELIDQFDISKINVNSTQASVEKAFEYNQIHLKRLLDSPLKNDIIDDVRALVKDRYYQNSEYPDEIFSGYYIDRSLTWAMDRIRVLQDIVSSDFDFLWKLPNMAKIESLQQSYRNLLENITVTHEAISDYPAEDFSHGELVAHLRIIAEKNNIKYGSLMKQLRGVLSGLDVGPSVAEIMTVLGKEQTLARLKNSIEKLR